MTCHGPCLQVVRCGTVAGVPKTWRETELWRDLAEVPEALAADAARRPTASTPPPTRCAARRRVIATGNGAAYYVAQALWLASLDGTSGPPVVAVPGGLVAGGRFNWRPGDRLLAISSSGEFRDVIDAVEQGAPRPGGVRDRQARLVARQAGRRPRRADGAQPARAHAHAGLLRRRRDRARACGRASPATTALAAALADAPAAVERGDRGDRARSWSSTRRTRCRSAAVVFGSGPAWAAALEGALFLKEVAMVPTEGCETREGATTAMFALGEGHLVLSLATARRPAARRGGAHSARRAARPSCGCPAATQADRRLAPITALPAITRLRRRARASPAGHDADHPGWEAAYYQTARRQ